MSFAFSPGCCCGEKCIVITDDWQRADSTSIGAAWDENSGDWSIASNKLTVASANRRMGNSGTLSISGATGQKLTGHMQSSANGDKLRLYLNTVNYVELVVGGSATLYYNPFGGSPISVTAAAGVEHTIVLKQCPSNASNLLFIIYLNGTPILWRGSSTLSSYTDFGYGTGNVLTGTPQFGTIEMEKFNATDCPDCETKHPTIQVSFTGATNGGGCTNCADYNTTFNLDWTASPTTPTGTGCSSALPTTNFEAWEVSTGGGDACGEIAILQARLANSGGFYLYGLESSGALVHVWRIAGIYGAFTTRNVPLLFFPDVPTGCNNGTQRCNLPSDAQVLVIPPSL